MKNSSYHTPVLLKEAVEALNIQKGDTYIDATLGGGGHSEEILKQGGIVLGIDRDDDAIDETKKRFGNNKNITVVKGNFEDIAEIAAQNNLKSCRGILVDLGTSVHQLRDESRGFSFSKHERIDMRMDNSQKLDGYEVINKWPKDELIEIFMKYGEENEAKEIAYEIVNKRKTKEIVYTDELADIIKSVKKRTDEGIHPATKVFQAIRIAVNDEMSALRRIMDEGFELLESGGRLVVISFHSLEDRIVKQKFREFERSGMGVIITKKAITPSFNEINVNKRSRSAKLRVFEKK